MTGNTASTVYIGNVDERVSSRVLYDILIQAGPVVDLHIPRDKETDKPKGYAFAEYETEEVADYAVRLFSGLVTLYNRTLKFALSGQDKSPLNTLPAANSGHRTRPHPLASEHSEIGQHYERFSGSHLFSPPHPPLDYSHEPPPPGVSPHSNGYGSYSYGRRVVGTTLDIISGSSRLRRS